MLELLILLFFWWLIGFISACLADKVDKGQVIGRDLVDNTKWGLGGPILAAVLILFFLSKGIISYIDSDQFTQAYQAFLDKKIF